MIAGLILAGGGGRRLGEVRKADLRLGNLPLVSHAIERVRTQADAVLLSLPEGEGTDTRSDVIALPDSPRGVTGPAAGLWAGAAWCAQAGTYDLMVSMAVDTPFFPRDFVTRSRPLLAAGTGCVVGTYDGRDFPTSALWSVPALHDALAGEARAEKGPRLRDLAARIGVAWCSYDDLAANPFAGINTLADLLALAKAARVGATET